MAGFYLPDYDEQPTGMGMALDVSSVTREQQQSAAAGVRGSKYGFGSMVAGTVGLAIPDLVDTVSSSVGLTERGKLTEKVLSGVGATGLMNFYNDNRGAIEVASGIAGVIAADYTAGRFLKPAGKAMQMLSKVPYANRIATLDQNYERALKTVQLMNQADSRRGVMGVEQFVGQTTLPALGQTAHVVSRESAMRGVRWAGIAKGAARNATTEAILLATQNQNSFLFAEDMSENLLWMGAGIGVGALIDRTQAIYAMRKYVNSDVVTRKFANAYDPTGVEGDRLRAVLSDDPIDGSLSHLGYLQGHYTDTATSYMVSARSLQNRSLTELEGLAGRRERLGTQQIGLARDAMQKATVRGIGGVAGTSFSMNTPGLGNHVNMKLADDPSSMYGVEHIGAAGGDTTLTAIHDLYKGRITQRQTYVQQVLREGGKWQERLVKESHQTKGGRTITVKVKKKVLVPLSEGKLNAYRAESKQLMFEQSLTPMVSTGKEWVPLNVGKALDGFQEPKIMREASDERKLWSVEEGGAAGNMSLSNDGELFLPDGKAVEDLDFFDNLRLYRLGQTAVDDMVATQASMFIPEKASWFQLDMAEALIQKTGDESLIQWGPGMTRQTAQVESFKQKVRALKKNPRIWDDPDAVAKARMQLNLPTLTAMEAGQLGSSEHAIEVLLRGADPKKVDELTYTDILQGLKEVRKINGLAAEAKDKVDSLAGDMFNFLRDGEGNPIKPFIAYKRPFASHQWTKEDLAERLAMRKAFVRDGLLNAEPEMTRSLAQTILSDPDFLSSAQIQALQDVQLQSMMPGFATAAPQTTRGGLLNSVTSREWRDRDNPVLLAAARIRDKGERLTRDFMKRRIEGFFGDVVSRVNGPRNTQSRTLLNQYFTFRPGWDLLDDVVEVTLANGQKGFTLKLDPKSAQNQKRWQKAYGETMPDGAVLRSPHGKDIVLDQLGLEFKERFNQGSADIIHNKNALLKSQGLGKINHAAHYAPPPNTKGKYIGFTLDTQRNPIPGGTIVASTPEEFARMENAMKSDPQSPLNQAGNVFYLQDELKDFATIWDRAQMDFISPGTTAAQPGKRGQGRLTGWEINPNAVDDAMTWLRDSYLQHGDELMRQLFKEQLNSADARAQIARASTPNQKRGTERQRSIYDYYTENLLGRSGYTSDASAVGRFYRGTEDWANRIISETAPHAAKLYRGVHDYVMNAVPGGRGGDSQQKAFEKLSKDLGPYMPFKNAAEMAERQLGAKRPPELAEITGDLSFFEATMRLRMFEVFHPLMNLAGVVNSIPSVVRHAQPMVGESTEDFAKRIGHSTQLFNLGDRSIGVLDMAKIGYRAMKRAWGRESHGDFDYMLGQGYITQEVAEFHRQFGAIDSKGAWKKFMTGDPLSTNRFGQKGIVGWTSVLSDRSEDFSRSWGHMVGLEVASFLGIENRAAKHNFAHDIANKMIANYDPKNRPEIFQGALGAPIGLFQSFIWNYYQRLFRYIETGDARSFATQYVSQGALFGVTGLPGWTAINKLFFDHSDGENSPYDAIYERFGQSTGDVLMGGTLSNLPKLANLLPGEQGIPGIDLYSRGDTNIRLPGLNPPPFVDTVSRVWQGIAQGAAAFSSSNPNLTDNRVAEILSNVLTNRPLAGFVEQALADGYDTDWAGQVAGESKGLMDSAYRIMGGRSMRQSKELEAFYSNKNAMEIQNAKMEDLRVSVRSSMRAGEYDSIPDYFDQYVLNGGDPRRFKRWLKSNYEAATTTRAERMLDDVMGDENKTALTQRLLDAGVEVEESEMNLDAYMIDEPAADLTADMPEGFLDPANSPEALDQFGNDPMASARF